MWDTVQTGAHQLSHDMPCTHCGHAMHTFLACSDACPCQPSASVTPKASASWREVTTWPAKRLRSGSAASALTPRAT